MAQSPEDIMTSKNVCQFDDDVRRAGSYVYTAGRLSARLANLRISGCVAESFDFKDKKVLDIGCGDGTYTLEFPALGVAGVVGIDPAGVAIEAANEKARKLRLEATVKFEVGSIYALGPYLSDDNFDCIVLRGVLHHLPDPATAVAELAGFKGTIAVLEPNGNNPVLKLLEKYSRYHIKHEERSFTPARICYWLTEAGFRVRSIKVFNLVPMFCPGWMAKALHIVAPLIEGLPLVRDIACGQCLFVARK